MIKTGVIALIALLPSNHKKVLGLAKEKSLHKEPTKVVIIKAQLIPKTYQSLL